MFNWKLHGPLKTFRAAHKHGPTDVVGYRVSFTGFNHLKFFCYTSNEGFFWVCEQYTGLAIPKSGDEPKSIVDALNAAQITMNAIGKAKFEAKIRSTPKLSEKEN